MRDCQVVADCSVEDVFLGNHAVDVLLCDIAAVNEDLTDGADRGLFVNRCVVEDDVLLQQDAAVEVMAACVGCVLVGLRIQDLLDDLIVLRSIHEVADSDDSCGRSRLSCALNQILVADDKLNACGNFGYRVVGNFDVSKTLRLELLLKTNHGRHIVGEVLILHLDLQL